MQSDFAVIFLFGRERLVVEKSPAFLVSAMVLRLLHLRRLTSRDLCFFPYTYSQGTSRPWLAGHDFPAA